MMKKVPIASSPNAYVDGLDGWRRAFVEILRANVREHAELKEVVKWGHLVFFSNGPVLLIRAEEERVLFGFWRGKRLRAIEPRLKTGGKYEMATMELHGGDEIDPATVSQLVIQAIALNKKLGDPTRITK
jgi:hypothetical protein